MMTVSLLIEANWGEKKVKYHEELRTNDGLQFSCIYGILYVWMAEKMQLFGHHFY